MILTGLYLSLLLIVSEPSQAPADPDASRLKYRAILNSAGGELPFTLEFSKGGDRLRAWIVNGPERIEIPTVSWDGRMLRLEFDHYDSRIGATAVAGGGAGALANGLPARFRGIWQKSTGRHTSARMGFGAELAKGDSRFPPLGRATSRPADGSVAGRWAVRFSKSDPPAVGLFEDKSRGVVEGTFLTTLGDYRYLAGSYVGDRLRLSCFDGAHAFLFDARRQPDGTLKGDFWSGDKWHETWTARRDEKAALPDAFGLTKWTGKGDLKDLWFRDLEGRPRSVEDPAFAGKVRIIEVFGSWCPNCHDAAAYTVELDRRYGPRGLRILGLAFELTGMFQRDVRQVRRFVERHEVKYPILIAGLSDKEEASRSLPILDRVRAYPTIILLGPDGGVRAVHTGFSGPATGEAHGAFRRRFEAMIEKALAEAVPDK